ncbi:MAG: DNA-protecting protein DprA [Eubacteriales bacterium]|nr:DNA-protecting protein DprA [Eubacteriales bacterium]
MKTSDRYWIWLADADVNVNSKAALVEAFGTAENIFSAEPGALRGVDGVLGKDADLLEKRDLSAADRIIKSCEAKKIRILTIDDPDYPSRLKNIYAPPYVLYVKGNLPSIDNEPILAVVGTRNATSYGKRMSKDIAYQFVKCGGMIASGLTAGIEECAAEAALSAGGTVIAYLGTSVEKACGDLAKRVAERGALISEYAPGTVTQKIFFRHRNRIGSGISAGVCAVEAPRKSGTALFVSEALEQGKQVFAVPGNADSEMSEGTLRFIKEGAMMITGGSEIAAELLPDFPEKLDPGHRETFRDAKKVFDNKKSGCYIEEMDIDCSGLSDIQKKILLSVSKGNSTVEELIRDTGIPAPSLLSQLTLLEIKKRIRNDREKGIVLSDK